MNYDRNAGDILKDLGELEEHAKKAQPIPTECIYEVEGRRHQLMERRFIRTMEQVFQPRTFEGQLGERYTLIQDLIDAIHRGSVDDLGPIMVWWSGQQWYVVDGHHRLIAVDRFNSEQRKREQKGQRRKKHIKDVPVSVIQGSLSEALRWATEENGKTRLSLTARQRSNWAWKLGALHWSGVLAGKFIIAQRHKELHVSERTLRTMKACWHKVALQIEEEKGRKLDPEEDRAELVEKAEMDWRNAERLSRGEDAEIVYDDEMRKKQVAGIAEKLVRAFGKQAFSSPQAGLIGEALLVASDKFAELSLGSLEFEAAMVEALRATRGYDSYLEDEPDHCDY